MFSLHFADVVEKLSFSVPLFVSVIIAIVVIVVCNIVTLQKRYQNNAPVLC